MTDHDENLFYLLVFSIAMTSLRYTSFALDWISKQKLNKANKAKTVENITNKKGPQQTTERIPVINEPGGQSEAIVSDRVRDKKSKTELNATSEIEVQYSLIDMLSYCLYLPYYFTGPITTYDEFYKQVCNFCIEMCLNRRLVRLTISEIIIFTLV